MLIAAIKPAVGLPEWCSTAKLIEAASCASMSDKLEFAFSRSQQNLVFKKEPGLPQS